MIELTPLSRGIQTGLGLPILTKGWWGSYDVSYGLREVLKLSSYMTKVFSRAGYLFKLFIYSYFRKGDLIWLVLLIEVNI